MQMTRDELEFSISQYVDGVLNPVQQSAIEEVLTNDADARAILAEYQQLNADLRTAHPMPNIGWDALAEHLSAEAGKLDLPIRNYRIHSQTWMQIVALAAMIVVVMGIAILVRRGQPGDYRVGGGRPSVVVNTSPSIKQPGAPIDIAISGAPSLASAAAATVDVSVGPAPSFVSADFADAIVSRPASIWIASDAPSAQDGPMPY